MTQSVTLAIDELSKFIEPFVNQLQPGDWVWLDGDLGAGKTTFVQHLAKCLGVQDNVASPTFSLMNVYGQLKNDRHIERLVHLDLYRLKKGSELFYVGLENEASRTAVTLVEWAAQLNDDEWDDFFATTRCFRPSRIHRIEIDIKDELTRCYSHSL